MNDRIKCRTAILRKFSRMTKKVDSVDESVPTVVWNTRLRVHTMVVHSDWPTNTVSIATVIFVYYLIADITRNYYSNRPNIRHAGRDTTAATQGSTIYRRVKPAKLLPHTAHSDWINCTGLTSWAFTRWCDRHTSDKVAHYSIYRPKRMKGWVGLGWLVTYRNKVPPPGVEPGHVTHPSTNRARRRVTSLIRPTPLPLRYAATHSYDVRLCRYSCHY